MNWQHLDWRGVVEIISPAELMIVGNGYDCQQRKMGQGGPNILSFRILIQHWKSFSVM